MQPFDAVLLAGGAGRRLGGVDKPGLDVGGSTLLDRALRAVDGAATVVVVGPPRDLPLHVRQVREEPPGGGPAAAVAAGLGLVTAPVVVVLAADLPRVTSDVVTALRTAAGGHDGALLVDGDGRDQVLTGVWSTAALRVAADGQDLHGRPVRALLDGLDVVRVDAPDGWTDCDSPYDLARARAGAGAFWTTALLPPEGTA